MFRRRILAAILVFCGVLASGGTPSPAQSDEAPSSGWGPSNPPPGMVFVPGGSFIKGGDENDDERPLGLFETGAFFIDATEVTNASFARVFPEHRYPAGQSEHPVSNVTHIQAREYAQKISVDLPRPWQKRLPTEEEWEKAARGTEGFLWPWGGIWFPERANAFGDGPVAVGSYPAGRSPYGCLDMIGNVWEWTLTPYRLPNTETGAYPSYVIKGGSWWPAEPVPTCAVRNKHAPEVSTALIGFRLVMPLPESLTPAE